MKTTHECIDLALGSAASPLGDILLAADAQKVVAISLRETRENLTCWLRRQLPQVRFIERDAWLSPAQDWLAAYFSGQQPSPRSLKFAFLGTPFQVAVWQELARLPYNNLITYGELGRRVGCASGQAVGQAVGRNPLPILVPCHRVVAANHLLGGFSSGLDNKRYLLAHEGFAVQGQPQRVYFTKGGLL
jgi:methylated-DNA-[protein]-cysteine S-methyltransferase